MIKTNYINRLNDGKVGVDFNTNILDTLKDNVYYKKLKENDKFGINKLLEKALQNPIFLRNEETKELHNYWSPLSNFNTRFRNNWKK